MMESSHLNIERGYKLEGYSRIEDICEVRALRKPLQAIFLQT